MCYCHVLVLAITPTLPTGLYYSFHSYFQPCLTSIPLFSVFATRFSHEDLIECLVYNFAKCFIKSWCIGADQTFICRKSSFRYTPWTMIPTTDSHTCFTCKVTLVEHNWAVVSQRQPSIMKNSCPYLWFLLMCMYHTHIITPNIDAVVSLLQTMPGGR